MLGEVAELDAFGEADLPAYGLEFALEQKLRDYLGGFGFQGDKVSEETRRFSGGEKARLVVRRAAAG
jgi:ATPase subunit of ABC transporter with duplicated ATPase domains